ncbi:MAG: AmmeMemoRadiSam system protein B [Myxococcales bacterium]|jgi:AmmeMemoRadiSam system protein B
MRWIRRPAVAGRFYPGDPARLSNLVAGFLQSEVAASPALAVVAPHAGYIYSGAIAGAAFARVQVPRTVIVLCPNHTGRGERRSLWSSGSWLLPGAELPVDVELAGELKRQAGLADDQAAHHLEHAVEVQLPFLRARNPEVRIVPLCLGGLTQVECLALGERIAGAVADRRGEVLLVASTDFSHYVPADEARDLDMLAIDRVRAVDPEGLFETVQAREISMCGYVPTTVVLAAARALGARSAELVRYGHSGETSGDFDQVVGYGGLTVPTPA